MRSISATAFLLCTLTLAAACSPDLEDVEEDMNVCTYESASCFDDTCPPGDDAYTVVCIDTTLTSCTIAEGVEEEYDVEIDTTFYFYTRNVMWLADMTCEDVM